METQKITTNLFSFKTFRSPDKIDLDTRNNYFIQHPDISKSVFDKCPLPSSNQGSEQQVTTFITRFNPAKSYKDIKAINPILYDFASELMYQKKIDSTRRQSINQLPKPLTESQLIRIWDELFFQTAFQKSLTVRQACTQLIIAQYYISNNKRLTLQDISRLVIVIPNEVIECFRNWRFERCGGKLFGVQNLGVQEYRRVEQTLCCYVAGEVSNIDNIMAREYKEKTTRNLLRTEYSSEFTTETEIENINDTTTTERNELSTEVAKELQKDRSFNLSGSVTVSKDSKIYGSITANVTSGYNSSSSSSLSNTEAKNYAKEVTERALERIVQKTTEKRTYKMIKEFEENNSHGFDNREGSEHVTGVYRWVDKIYDNEMVNYGRRLLFEVSVPTPARFYKMAMEWKNKKLQETQNTLTAPPTLIALEIKDATSVTSATLAAVNTAYGTSIPAYVNQEKTIDVQFNNDTEHKAHRITFSHDPITLPEGFIADKIIDGRISMHFRATGQSAYTEVFINSIRVFASGDQDSGSATTRDFSISFDFDPNLGSPLDFEVAYKKVFDYHGWLKIKCISGPELYALWQAETYAAMQDAYNTLNEKYQEELQLQQAASQAAADQEDNQNYSNPAMNRLIEERELKRICIEMMSKPYCYDLGLSFYDCKEYKCETKCETIENKIPEVLQNEALEKYAEFIKFFETAFHWEIFSYIFYPYYYNAKCEWSALLQTKNDDPIFEAFLQSGMAKILVPVRPQYEKAVMWYLETGEIYTEENLVPETEDERYLSLLAELQNQDEIKVEGTWKTRVPSTLTIIQGDTTYLAGEGLPCCDKETKVFTKKETLLQGLKSE